MKFLNYKDISIPILFETEDFVVLNKPDGLIVELSYESDKFNVKDIISEVYNPAASITQQDIEAHKNDKEYNVVEEFKERQGLVHRLDADTSGVMVVSKTLKGFIHLKKQFMNRTVFKKYVAISYEKFSQAGLNQVIEINAPIGRSKKNRTKFIILEEGKPAVTQFKQIKFIGDDFTVWECIPKTGRTHQIRVHLTSLNCPILGDSKYSGIVRTRRDKDRFTRLFLHAFVLGFHDLNGKYHEFLADLPTEFTDLINHYKT